ncbi:hypothetical protein RND71_039310 [Anisodus tanguticus]|uniref:Uncharacterized protein n=1 Tax=Anisodus tanguticus TaxID=243964 RepID=A0AAE1UXH3_9SOLA|nr:hypothetical protein RND71_039310 [Anisodus tanguticus]
MRIRGTSGISDTLAYFRALKAQWKRNTCSHQLLQACQPVDDFLVFRTFGNGKDSTYSFHENDSAKSDRSDEENNVLQICILFQKTSSFPNTSVFVNAPLSAGEQLPRLNLMILLSLAQS